MNKSKLVFATNNVNKLSEIKDLLPNFQILDLNDIKLLCRFTRDKINN